MAETLNSFDISPLAAKELKDNVRIFLAMAQTDTEPEEARKQLEFILTDLVKKEKACEDYLEAIRECKKIAIKEINNKVIDSKTLNFTE